MINFSFLHLFIGIAILVMLLVFLDRRKRNFWYLVCFSIFGIYLLFVVSVVVFPIAPLSKEHWGTFKLSLNLIPFYFGTCDIPRLCLRNVIGNIFLTIPFGFGISFITHVRRQNVFWLSIFVGLTFEITQLVISLVFRSAFRTVDINDVIFNTIGALFGYGIFRIFGWLYLHLVQHFEIKNKHFFVYVYDVVRQSTAY